MTPHLRDLLIQADSLLSLVAYRHRMGPIPEDVREEMIRASLACRNAYEAHDRAAPAPSPAPPQACPECEGNGWVESVWGEDKRRCPYCGGTGKK